MSGKLQCAITADGTKTTVAEYDFEHSSNEVNTILNFGVKIVISHHGGDGRCNATIHFDGCNAKTPEEAISRLANWCERASQELKNYKPDTYLPL